MSQEPLSYSKIENGLRSSINRQDELTSEFAKTGDTLALAEVAYKKAFAEARLYRRSDTEGKRPSNDVVDDDATVATQEQHQEFLVARAKHDAVKQALYSTRERINALRSLMASYRAVSEDN